MIEMSGGNDALHAEKHPTQIDHKESEKHRRNPTNLLEHVKHKETIEDLEQAMERTPKNEVPAGAMPKARTEEDNNDVNVSA